MVEPTTFPNNVCLFCNSSARSTVKLSISEIGNRELESYLPRVINHCEVLEHLSPLLAKATKPLLHTGDERACIGQWDVMTNLLNFNLECVSFSNGSP